MFNMEKTRTSSYHTENDGMLEQMICTGLQDMLAKYLSDHQFNWDEHLLLAMMGYRSSAHASTQCTPFYLLFGHEVRLPVDVMFRPQPNHKREVSDYVGNLHDTLEEVHKHAREHLSSCPEMSAGPSLPANCWRAKLRLVIKYSFMTQLHSPWQGPYIVMTWIGKLTHRIQAVNNPRKRKLVHFNHLKLCGAPNTLDQPHSLNQTASPVLNTSV